MNKPIYSRRATCDRGGTYAAARGLWRVGALALLSATLVSAQAEGTVVTLGGGPLQDKPAYGYQDGPTLQEAQFHTPYGCALDPSGNYLYVADRDNGCIRLLDLSGDLTSTFLSGLNSPVAVCVDADDNVYVVDQGAGRIIRYDMFGDFFLVASNLVNPSALVRDGDEALYVAEAGPLNGSSATGTIKRISLADQEVTLVANGLLRPGGLALLDSGVLAVSETGRHVIKFIQPQTGTVVLQIGKLNTPGFHDGASTNAAFNQPQQLAKAPNGSLALADRGNHRVRLIDPFGVVTTLYGIDPDSWSCDYPGWLDGDVRYAEAREPIGVTFSSDGTLYTTEVYYHIIRKMTGTGAGGSGGGDTNVVAKAPVLSLESGYLPMGQVISVFNPNTNLFFNTEVYYTTDGSDPTTNALRVDFTNNVGTIYWRESLRDLSSLRVKAFLGNGTTATARGQMAPVNQIGIHRDLVAGIGANAIVPVVLNLRDGVKIQSLQYRVEVTPKTTETPPIPFDLQALDVDTNSFVSLAVSSRDDTTFTSYAYSVGKTRGLVISFLGSFANFEAERFGAAGVISIPIPAEAVEGNSYTIRVLEYSATADASQTPVTLTNLPSRTLLVTNVPYLIGDCSPGTWYNAGDFGDGRLDNSDVNMALYASLGLQLPYPNSDAFDAMDIFPEDLPPAAGGDGQIRFLDWQTTLLRSLRLPGYGEDYFRHWSIGGVRVATMDSDSGHSAASPALDVASGETPEWCRPAQLTARPLENIGPGARVDVPVYLNVRAGSQVAGLQFRARVAAPNRSPKVVKGLEFVPAFGLTQPARKLTVAPGQIAVAWNVGDFKPAITGSNLLGYLRFTIPPDADQGSQYQVSFLGADGSPDLTTQYDFESFPASVWVWVFSQQSQSPMSAEWITNYFGSADNPWAIATADPDADGVANQQEYQLGHNPVKLRLHPVVLETGSGAPRLKLRWFGVAGKKYILESATDLRSGPWTVIADSLPGQGSLLEVSDTPQDQSPRFYRVRLQSSNAALQQAIPRGCPQTNP